MCNLFLIFISKIINFKNRIVNKLDYVFIRIRKIFVNDIILSVELIYVLNVCVKIINNINVI